ncbi:MAG: hypothetical protein MRY74_05950 [Neomegalonema sp.]|nr:hypothetical protein [Neomegalonema sp.]
MAAPETPVAEPKTPVAAPETPVAAPAIPTPEASKPSGPPSPAKPPIVTPAAPPTITLGDRVRMAVQSPFTWFAGGALLVGLVLVGAQRVIARRASARSVARLTVKAAPDFGRQKLVGGFRRAIVGELIALDESGAQWDDEDRWT